MYVQRTMHPSYDYGFFFVHCDGNAKQRPAGCNQGRMNGAFGGKAILMQNTVISIQEEGYLGPFSQIVGPGDNESLVFSPSSIGPFWMSDVEKEKSRFDKHLGSTTLIPLKMSELKIPEKYLTAMEPFKKNE